MHRHTLESIKSSKMSNSWEHSYVSLRWMAGRTSIESISYPSSISPGEAWGILLPNAVYPSAVPHVPRTKERQQPMGRICKGQEIHGLQEASSKYWSCQQATAWFCIHSLVHVLMKQNKSSDNTEVNISTYSRNYIYLWLMHATLKTAEGWNDGRNYKKYISDTNHIFQSRTGKFHRLEGKQRLMGLEKVIMFL